MNIKKIVLLIISIAIFVGIIIFLNIRDGKSNSSDGRSNGNHDKIYNDFQDKIKRLESSSWDASAYMAIKMAIQQAENANPTPLISLKDAQDIKELLSSTYLNVLFKESKRYCETEPLTNSGYLAIEDEIVKEIPENSKTVSIRSAMMQSLNFFKSAVSLPSEIETYTSKSLFSASRTQMYTQKINDITGDSFIKNNEVVKSVLNSQFPTLNTHQSLDDQIHKFFTIIYPNDVLKAKSFACKLSSSPNYKQFTAYSKKYCSK